MAKSSRRPKGAGEIKPVGKDKWVIVAEHGRKANGARKRVTRTVYGKKEDAERELMKLKVELGAKPNFGDVMTLDEYFYSVFVPVREASLLQAAENPNYHPLVKRKTLDTYLSIYRTHIQGAFGSWPADQIGRVDVQRWALRLPTAATAEKAVRHLRAILRAMWDDELLDDEPMHRRVKLPRHTVDPIDVWTDDELMDALDRLQGQQLEGLVLAMAGGGLRREEALAFDLPGAFSFDRMMCDGEAHIVCRAIVRSAWVEREAQRDDTKTYRARPITIGEPFAPRLEEVISDGRPKLLMSRDGRRPITPSSVPETWRRAFGPGRPLAGMRFVELRTLRHCHETTSARAGITDAVNSSVHGHSQQVMYSHYLTLGSDDADAVAEAVRARLAR